MSAFNSCLNVIHRVSNELSIGLATERPHFLEIDVRLETTTSTNHEIVAGNREGQVQCLLVRFRRRFIVEVHHAAFRQVDFDNSKLGESRHGQKHRNQNGKQAHRRQQVRFFDFTRFLDLFCHVL